MKAFPTYDSTKPTPPAKTPTASNVRQTAGQVIVVTAGQLTLNATLGGIKIPAGATVVGATLMSTDIDTNGSAAVVLAVGDAGDVDRLITSATVGQAGGLTSTLAITGYAYTYTAETTVAVTVTTAPATAAAGTITFSVDYVVN